MTPAEITTQALREAELSASRRWRQSLTSLATAERAAEEAQRVADHTEAMLHATADGIFMSTAGAKPLLFLQFTNPSLCARFIEVWGSPCDPTVRGVSCDMLDLEKRFPGVYIDVKVCVRLSQDLREVFEARGNIRHVSFKTFSCTLQETP